ncbi:hypothetical protein MMC19_000822 [Ptychographa xylographoides]|nr:hypothetical protein [Ptychographa xylographoides]
MAFTSEISYKNSPDSAEPGYFPRSIVSRQTQPIDPDTVGQQPQIRSSLFRLPLEIRLQIYELILAQIGCPRHCPIKPPRGVSALSLLRINRAIYNEARLLPFQKSEIVFQRWYGSSVFCCNGFLKSIQPWQRQEIRALNLAINGRELDGWQAREGWLQMCALLGEQASSQTGLRSLIMGINGTRGFLWENVLKEDASWVVDGLDHLKSLTTLVVTLVDGHVEQEAIRCFEQVLKQRVPSASVRMHTPSTESGKEYYENSRRLWNL